MPLPRVRLRALMIAVAVAGMLLGAVREATRLRRLSERYRRLAWRAATAEIGSRARAAREASSEQADRRRAATFRSLRVPGVRESPVRARWTGEIEESATRHRNGIRYFSEVAAYNRATRRRYERAARYPWLPVPPGPPAPK